MGEVVLLSKENNRSIKDLITYLTKALEGTAEEYASEGVVVSKEEFKFVGILYGADRRMLIHFNTDEVDRHGLTAILAGMLRNYDKGA